jgi:hypothetical protein
MPDRLSDAETELKLLRAQIGRLITENLALRQQVDQLIRQKAEMPVQAIAEAAMRSVMAAEDAMAREASGDRRYTIPEIEASIRGVVVAREGAIALRVPSPEQPVSPAILGSVHVTVAQVPPPIGSVPRDVIAPTRALESALERAQALFAGWAGRRGATGAEEVVAAVTQVLGTVPEWKLDDLRTGLESVIDAAAALAEKMAGRAPRRVVDACLAASRELREVLRSVQTLSREDMDKLAAGVDRLVETFAALAAAVR